MTDRPVFNYGETIPGMRSVSIEERIGLKLAPDGTVALDAWPIGSSVTVTLDDGRQVSSVTESHAFRQNKKRPIMIKVAGHGDLPVSRVRLKFR